MNIKSFPNNADEFVGAEPLMKWFHGRTSGVWSADGNAAVRPSSPASMQVQVEDGTGWISNANSDGIAWWNDVKKSTGSTMRLAVDRADPALDRIDRVVVSWPTVSYKDPPTITVLKGAPGSNAAPPKLTNTATLRMISLAQILVPAGCLSITEDLITDERLDPDVCGLVSESASIDTSMIMAQFMALLESLRSAIQDTKDGSAYLFKAGDKMSGSLDMSTHSIKNLASPVDAGDAVNKGALDSACGKTVLLWTNQAPKKAFRPQKVTINLSAYDAVIIEATIWHQMDHATSIFAIKGSSARLFACDTQVLSYRNAAVTNAGVDFEAGHSQETISGEFGTENSALIPSRIYGVKFGGGL